MPVRDHIRDQFVLSLGRYGRPRMTKDLKELGRQVGHRPVGRLTKENGIQVKQNKKIMATTDGNYCLNVAAHLLNLDVHAAAPNQK